MVIFHILLAISLVFIGMVVVFAVYMWFIWVAASNAEQPGSPVNKGLSAADLEQLPKTSGKELTRGTECTVCLDEIGAEQQARVVPGRNHGFHIHCADAWLSKHSVCPVCRANIALVPQ